MPRWLAGALVFVASGSVLVLEILAGRLLAPYVGVSLETYTGIIGVVLAGIATGAWIGGWLADRHDPRRLLPGALVGGGALAITAVPLVRLFGSVGLGPSPPVIVFLAAVGFFLPSAILSAVTPLVVKIQLDSVAETGTVVGSLSAIGTAGSLVGVFVTGFVLVAAFPTTPVIIVVGGLLVVAGVTLWLRSGRRLPAQLVAGAVALAAASSGASVIADGPCQVETAYFCARVEVDSERPTGRTLWLDTLRHSYIDLADPTYLELTYAQSMADVIDSTAPPGEPLDAVHVGGGGFSLPRYLAAVRPGSRSLVLELDPSIVELDEQQLGLVLDDDLRVVTGDARNNLRNVATDSAALVIGDAFGGRSVPWHLTTREFVEDVDRVLRPDGVYALNVIDQGALGFVRAEVATLRAVFDHVAIVGPPERLAATAGGNFILVASDAPIPAGAITRASAARGDTDQVLADPDGLEEFTGGADVLTDDHAPVDQLLGP
ncbi:MAG: spermidine synthase [Acidimicrobiia bacterium]|nr:spermidine synthase [Acidimicrobiia bacterium]